MLLTVNSTQLLYKCIEFVILHMTEQLITVSSTQKVHIYRTVSPDEVRGRYYRLVPDPSVKAGARWTRQRDLTLYRHEDGVWRTRPEPDEPEEMKDWIGDFDIRDEWIS
jgi:hypothetical protein